MSEADLANHFQGLPVCPEIKPTLNTLRVDFRFQRCYTVHAYSSYTSWSGRSPHSTHCGPTFLIKHIAGIALAAAVIALSPALAYLPVFHQSSALLYSLGVLRCGAGEKYPLNLIEVILAQESTSSPP